MLVGVGVFFGVLLVCVESRSTSQCRNYMKIASPITCRDYMECVDGKFQIKTCSNGKLFDIKLSHCRDSARAHCNYVSCQGNAKYPDPTSLKSFYRCANGKWTREDCKDGWGFEPVRLECTLKEDQKRRITREVDTEDRSDETALFELNSAWDVRTVETTVASSPPTKGSTPRSSPSTERTNPTIPVTRPTTETTIPWNGTRWTPPSTHGLVTHSTLPTSRPEPVYTSTTSTQSTPHQYPSTSMYPPFNGSTNEVVVSTVTQTSTRSPPPTISTYSPYSTSLITNSPINASTTLTPKPPPSEDDELF